MNKDRNRIIFYIISSIICGFALPWLCDLLRIKVVLKVVIVLFIINLIYAFVFGIMLARYHDSLWYQLLMPCIFAITTLIMKLNAHIVCIFFSNCIFIGFLLRLFIIYRNQQKREIMCLSFLFI